MLHRSIFIITFPCYIGKFSHDFGEKIHYICIFECLQCCITVFLLSIWAFMKSQGCFNKGILFQSLFHNIGPVRHVSQCFATKGNPFISMHCGPQRHLTVLNALHGRHYENRSECSALEYDCTEDQMRSFYDWQDCIGRSQCVMSVQQSWMPSCGNYSQFLQADYTCVPSEMLTYFFLQRILVVLYIILV